ncbi:MAG TPA: hypothetical protein VLI04_14270 [Nocardioidaceae bacterium]|nr:hypothetical protein [Nocardioidaceae bacterium]
MEQEEAFDAFYRTTRSDVLLQAFLLTGDLTAAAAAVKDGYTITWQHWKKVVALEAAGEEPMGYVRPLVWRLAQRRHTGRLWHRNKGLSDEHKLVLDAVHKLASGPRRAVLLVDLAGVDVGAAARELGLTAEAATARLETGRTGLADSLGADHLERLRSLAAPAATAKLPRPSIVLRAGRSRRRLTAVVSVTAAVALTVGAGAAAREPGQDRNTAVHQVLPGGKPVGEKLPEGIELTTPESLLEPFQLADLSPKQTWTTVRTDNNTTGDGINIVCQATRFADPRGLAALVRTYDTEGKPQRTALQTVEISRDTTAASRAYDTTVGWFAGCQVARLRLLSAYRVTGVGDEAGLMKIRVAGDPVQTYDVAVARTREITTTVVMRTVDGISAEPADLATTLGDAVEKLCPTTVTAGCVMAPRAIAVPPPPSGEERGFVGTVDLPPVGALREPWLGTPSTNALKLTDETTRCDRANFRKAGATKARARTFLIPEAEVPATFGFTETVGTFKSAKAAIGFLADVRRSVAGCEDRDLTTEVSAGASGRDFAVWRFDNKVSDDVTVVFRVGFVRVGDRVAKLSFVPDAKNDMEPEDFAWLVQRAGERLRELS